MNFSSVKEQLAYWLDQQPPLLGTGYTHISQLFPQDKGGIDVAMPYHTPVYAVASGPVTYTTPQYGGGGVVVTSIASNMAFYYQHLSDLVVQPGEYVQAGQLIGYSGGQVGYGDNPSSPQYSTGPHIEVGINWWKAQGAHIDPLPFIQQLANNYSLHDIGTSSAGGTTVQANPTSTQTSNATQSFGIGTITDWVSSVSSWIGNPLRVVKLVVGIALLLLAVIVAFLAPEAKQVVGSKISGAKTAAIKGLLP